MIKHIKLEKKTGIWNKHKQMKVKIYKNGVETNEKGNTIKTHFLKTKFLKKKILKEETK